VVGREVRAVAKRKVISISPGGGRPCGQGDQKGKDHAGNQRRIEKERPEGDWS